MRIIAGKYGGRTLKLPKGLPARPTTDRTREALFNILNSYIDWESSRMLDLFAGTGAVSTEAISRGIKEVIAVEQHRKSVFAIKSIWKELGIMNAKVIPISVERFLKQDQDPFDLIFMDPPYAKEGLADLVNLILEKDLLKQEGVLVLEHINKKKFDHLNHFSFSKNYGTSVLSFFSEQ